MYIGTIWISGKRSPSSKLSFWVSRWACTLGQYGDLLPLIHIVPMYMPKFLRDSEKAKRKDPAAFGERIFKYKALMGALLGFLSSNATTLQDDIDRIVQLELELGEIDKEDYWRSNDTWEVVTVQQLSRLVPTVEWKDYIQSCLKTGPTERA